MKIYVAGKWGERQICKQVMTAIERDGHEITCDWTNHDYPPSGTPESEKQALLQKWASLDIQGVRDADALVFIAIIELNYRGAFVEMGAALGKGIPVFVIGHGIDTCVFIDHPLIRKVEKIAHILPALKSGN